MTDKQEKPTLPKMTIAEMDLFDVPMVGVFNNKEFTAYTLSTLAGIEVDDLDDMVITVEDFMANPEQGKRNMRMDARVNIKKGEERANIEIQRVKKDDEAARALNYAGGLVTSFPKGLEKLPKTKNTVIFICDFDPFISTPYEGQTRMRYTLSSDDDESRFHTLSGIPYPFDGLTIIIYNGKQDWNKNPPKSEEEDRIRIYLEDMKKANPNDMISEIAMKASKEYKEDPKSMSKTEDWIKYNFAEYFDEQAKEYKKKIQEVEEEKTKVEEEKAKVEEEKAKVEEKNARLEDENARLKEENEKNLINQSIQFAKNLIDNSSLPLSEIAKLTGLDESELKNISQ